MVAAAFYDLVWKEGSGEMRVWNDTLRLRRRRGVLRVGVRKGGKKGGGENGHEGKGDDGTGWSY